MKLPKALLVSVTAPYAFQNPSAFPSDGRQFWKTRLAVLKGMADQRSGEYTAKEMQAAIEEAESKCNKVKAEKLVPSLGGTQWATDAQKAMAAMLKRRDDLNRIAQDNGYLPNHGTECEYCHTILTDKFEADHVPPLAHAKGYQGLKRLRLSCQRCNRLLSDFKSVCVLRRTYRVLYRDEMTELGNPMLPELRELMYDNLERGEYACDCDECAGFAPKDAAFFALHDPVIRSVTPRPRNKPPS